MPTQGETLVAARTKFASWASRTAKAELAEMAKGCICVQNVGGVLIDTARIQAPGLCDTHGEVRGKVKGISGAKQVLLVVARQLRLTFNDESNFRLCCREPLV
jgi:hypothetical protein